MRELLEANIVKMVLEKKAEIILAECERMVEMVGEALVD